MTIRFAVMAAAALACAGCANQGLKPMGLGYHGQLEQGSAIAATMNGPGHAVAQNAAIPADVAVQVPRMRQTLGGKVLSAIALERVTGRKPDPSRFNELN
ncbi:MAG: hypothetical protein KDJ45_10265 [Hyphomicrobiaceae bacterium]|nr:hypothetical protein [Hyphomicrobiaceae bacterium]MCC0011374.1 hypothetical protein [Hyphomicrobiaceae bacterium]